MDKLLKDIKEIEFSKIQYNKESENYFEYTEGKIPILISAPHGARHLRDGSWKEEDEYTAGIAIKLAEITDAHVIYVKNATKEDSNYDIETKFKDKIREIVKNHGIKFIADIHGANSNRPFKVSVGIINDETEKCSCPSFKEIIQETFKTFQNDIFNLCNFSASKSATVTSFAKNILNIEAAQFEINAKYRIVDRKPDSSYSKIGMDSEYKADENNVIELLSHLEKMVLRINQKIENE
jgi:hypothetical protein